MDPFEILERIGSDNPPTADELTQAQTEIARLIHAATKQSPPDLEALTSLRATHTQIGEAITAAEQAEAELQAQVAELTDGIVDPDADGDTTADGSGDTTATTDTGDGNDDGSPAGDGADGSGRQPVTATLSLAEAAARVRNRLPADPVPEPQTEIETVGTNKVTVRGVEHTGDITLRDIAHAFDRATRSPGVGKQTHIQFEMELPANRQLPGDASSNTDMLDQWTGVEAVAAAGGCCSLATPLRTQDQLSSRARPLRDKLPTMSVAEAGAVSFFPAVCLPQAGASTWTCAEDELVDPLDPLTWKDCAVIDCPDEDRVNVESVYHCATIGNFQRRFAPAQWSAVLSAILAEQARLAEQTIWAQMLAGVSSAHTVTATGSTYVTLVQSLLRAAATIRQDQRYEDVQLNVFAASWLPSAIAADLVARRVVDQEDPAEVSGLIESALNEIGVDITYTPDIEFIEDPGTQVTGPLTDFPVNAEVIIAPEGYYTFLDGGQFDLGTEIRDHDLNRQNAVAAFAESFEAVLARGCNAKALTIPIETCELPLGCGEPVA